MVIGKLWLQVARLVCDLQVAGVESKANVADGPSRDDFSILTTLGASFVEPIIPSWMDDIWTVPALE